MLLPMNSSHSSISLHSQLHTQSQGLHGSHLWLFFHSCSLYKFHFCSSGNWRWHRKQWQLVRHCKVFQPIHSHLLVWCCSYRIWHTQRHWQAYNCISHSSQCKHRSCLITIHQCIGYIRKHGRGDHHCIHGCQKRQRSQPTAAQRKWCFCPWRGCSRGTPESRQLRKSSMNRNFLGSLQG